MNLLRFVPGLFGRLALAFTLGFGLLLSGVLCWSHYVEDTARQQGEQKLHLGLAQQLLSENPQLLTGRVEQASLANALHILMVLGPNFEFYLLAPDGEVLTYSGPASALKRKYVDTQPLVTLIQNPTFLPQFADDPRSISGQQIFSVAPIVHSGVLHGFFYVVIGSQQAAAVKLPLLATWKSKQTALIFIFSGLFLGLSLLLLFGYITKPLRVLQQDIRRVMAQNFVVPPEVDQRLATLEQVAVTDEIGQLHRDFASFVREISSQWLQLQQLELQRKTLLADLSHDLRTPLMALHGQLELLSEGANPSELPALNLALSRSSQLQRLVDQIFELAFLDAMEVPLQVETICLNELLHDIAARYQREATSRQIDLQSEGPVEHCLIATDVGKLERVLANLLDNAIRHTATGGQVRIQLQMQQNAYLVRVYDNGCGIHPDDLACIFKPRFRARNSRNDQQIHYGLGLAISTKLCQLLSIDISVQSQLGSGADFRLQLAALARG